MILTLCFTGSIALAADDQLNEVPSSISVDFDGRENTEVNLGVVPAGMESIVELKLVNKTSETLTILSSKGSCACLIGNLDKQVVKPGEPILLKLHARPAAHVRGLEQPLEVSMEIGGSKAATRRLQVSAKVLPLFRIEPTFVDVNKGKSESVDLKALPNFRECAGELTLSPIAGKIDLLSKSDLVADNSRVFTVKVHPDQNPRSSCESLTLDLASQFVVQGDRKEVRCSTSFDLRFRDHVSFRPTRVLPSNNSGRSVGVVLVFAETHWEKGYSFDLWHEAKVIGKGVVANVEDQKTTLRFEIENDEHFPQYTSISFALPDVGRLAIDVRDE